MFIGDPIFVTGAAGSLSGVDRTVVELLRQPNLPVRANVPRRCELSVLRSLSATSLVPATWRGPWRAAGECTSG
jgi:hypothetical protein